MRGHFIPLVLLSLSLGCTKGGASLTTPLDAEPAAARLEPAPTYTDDPRWVQIPNELGTAAYAPAEQVPSKRRGMATLSPERSARLAGTTPKAAASVEPPPKATPYALLTAFFAESTVCPLPAKLARKLKKSSATPFLPAAIQTGIKGVKDVEGVLYAGRSLAVVIHSANVKGATTTPVDIEGAPTMTDVNLLDLRLGGYNNVYYSVDCSGYFNASAEAKAGFTGVNVKSSTAAKLSRSSSMVALYASLASPVAVAMAPERFTGIRGLTPEQRMGLLVALHAATFDRQDTDRIEAPLSLQVVGTAVQTNQAMQGSLDASASGGVSAGVGSVSGQASAGFTISNKILYSLFDSILLPGVTTGVVSAPLSEIRLAAKQMVRASRVGATLDTIQGAQVLKPRLPKGLCLFQWTLAKQGSAALEEGDFGGVTPTFDDGSGVCSIKMALKDAGVTALADRTLMLHFKKLGLVVPVAQ